MFHIFYHFNLGKQSEATDSLKNTLPALDLEKSKFWLQYFSIENWNILNMHIRNFLRPERIDWAQKNADLKFKISTKNFQMAGVEFLDKI